MFTQFFRDLRDAGVPVSLTEYLSLMEGMNRGLPQMEVERFYYLSRMSLVKDERYLDRFDRVFARTFEGVSVVGDAIVADIPEDWLRKLTEKHLTPEEMAEIESLGGWDNLMETLKKRLEEQTERHQGGNKWIGTGGTSPFGAYGYNPEGVRIGQDRSRYRRAVKVWDKRQFKDLDGDVELGTRNLKMALRRLRRFARRGAAEEFDLGGTIDATAKQGYLDVKMRPERRNLVKVLIFFDAGGSMDPYVRVCEELFSAARSEFKHLEYYYFHNCLYEYVWRENRRRWTDRTDTWDVFRTYGDDWKVIIVGDAAMSPYEITVPGGANEHFNEEAGAVWLDRMVKKWERLVWLNPVPEQYWRISQSTQLVQEVIGPRMFPLTLEGVDAAMGQLKR